MDASKLTPGTRIYYTGDMANEPARLVVIDATAANVRMREEGDESGRVWNIPPSGIGDEHHGHGDPRFVTMEARERFCATSLAALASIAARAEVRP